MPSKERDFQTGLYKLINNISGKEEEISMVEIAAEIEDSDVASGKLYSCLNTKKNVFFELLETKWDTTDENLVMDANTKALNNNCDFFVTGSSIQLVIYKTFEPKAPANKRGLKIFTFSGGKNKNAILLPPYRKDVIHKVKLFLHELSDLLQGKKEFYTDSIDKFLINKLSLYILEASAAMSLPMYEKIKKNKPFREELKQHLKKIDVFNSGLHFDKDDVYRICILSNYVLYLKIIFYSSLQRDVPELKLKALTIPGDQKLLNLRLKERFGNLLNPYSNFIFEETIFDKFEFEAKYIPILKWNIAQINKFNFKEADADIIGAVYNTIIGNPEQHYSAQHFTNTHEVDIVNAFCINDMTHFILDSACGAGTFLVRAYYSLKKYNSRLTSCRLLEKIYGVEMNSFAAFLTTMNVTLLDSNTKKNYPLIFNSDFSKVRLVSTDDNILMNGDNTRMKKGEIELLLFDACVGNPPYIRQELIENKKIWSHLAFKEFGIKKVNQQSDLYVYYLIHTASFLKDGGRLGYVISASWLDISFGAGLQKFLLNNFKIIAIIDQQKKRSFETASINTVILIIEKCENQKAREKNNVKFVRIFSEYEKVIGINNERFAKVNEFARKIEKTKSNFQNEDVLIEVVNQHQLEMNSTIDDIYKNGHWGALYLRSPEIFNKIISKAGNKLIPLSKIIEVKYGIKTGANDFFYLTDETEKAKKLDEATYQLTFGVEKKKHLPAWNYLGWFYSKLTNEHFIIEKEFMKPVFKTQSEAFNLDADISHLKNKVLLCGYSRSKLKKQKKHLLKYIDSGEQKKFQIDKRPSCQNNENWYNLTSKAFVGDFIFPAKIGEKFRLIDNRQSNVYCDKVNYVFKIRKEYRKYSHFIFMILNSIFFRYFVDLFARQLTGSQTLSDVDVNLVEQTLVINPSLLLPRKKELMQIYLSLKGREQETIYKEIKKVDKKKLDTIIIEQLGLTAKDVDELYVAAVNYVKDRQQKSESLFNQ